MLFDRSSGGYHVKEGSVHGAKNDGSCGYASTVMCMNIAMCYVIFCGGEPYSARGKLHILHRTLRERSLSSHEAQQKEDGGTRYHVKPQAKEIRAMSRKEEKRPINTYAGVLLQYDRCVEYG
jgi:hypothetical protein